MARRAVTFKLSVATGWDDFILWLFPERIFARRVARKLMRKCPKCPTCDKHVNRLFGDPKQPCDCGPYCNFEPTTQEADLVIVLPTGSSWRVADGKGNVEACGHPEIPVML